MIGRLEEAKTLALTGKNLHHIQHRIFSLYWEAVKLFDRQASWHSWNKVKTMIASSAFYLLISHQQLLFASSSWNDFFDLNECVSILLRNTIEVTMIDWTTFIY